MFRRPRSPRAAVLAIGAALAFAVPVQVASADGPKASTSPPRTTALPPATAHAWLHLPDVFSVDHRQVTVPHRAFHVVGGVRPYVPGQLVTLRAYVGRRLIRSGQFQLRPGAGSGYGEFRAAIASPASGTIAVSVTYAAASRLARFEVQRTVSVLSTRAGFGAKGTFIQLIQERLAALHFYIPQTGVYDEGTGLALDAYHRLLRWGTSQTPDARTINALLDGHGTFKVRFPGHGRHAEGDLSLQLLALVDGSRVDAIYPISSGKPSTPTILGDFRVYSKVTGRLPDGMYDSNFFHGGYAIHGYNPAPDYPASHGCMRLPVVDAPSVYAWLRIGDWVDTYY